MRRVAATVDAKSADFKLDDHVPVDAKVSCLPTENPEFHVRVENSPDQDCQAVRGFGTPGFTALAGLRAEF